MTKLDEQGLQDAAAKLPAWSVGEQGLEREVRFADFKAALEFVNRVGALAEAAGHHPDIDIRYNKVRLALVTHDAGGVTSKDVEMAESLTRELPE